MPAKIHSAEFAIEAVRWPPEGLESRPLFAFAGRSNVGKSSLLNTLTGRKGLARTSRTPGRTQSIIVFGVELRTEEKTLPVYFLDLPGFGYAKAPKAVRQSWTPMMRGALNRNPDLRAVLLLLDVRHAPTRTDVQAIEQLTAWETPWLPVATKCDKLGKMKLQKRLKEIADDLGADDDDIRPFSSQTGKGRDNLLDEIASMYEPV